MEYPPKTFLTEDISDFGNEKIIKAVAPNEDAIAPSDIKFIVESTAIIHTVDKIA